MAWKRKPIADRFWSYVAIASKDECWPWTGTTDGHGYGAMSIDGRHRGPEKAYRIAFALTFGPIPTGLSVCHHCDNPPCCNPEHLFLGTHKDNMRDMHAKGRGLFASAKRPILAGELNPLAKLTNADVPLIFKFAAEGMQQRAIARHFGVSQKSIANVLHGRTWRSIPR